MFIVSKPSPQIRFTRERECRGNGEMDQGSRALVFPEVLGLVPSTQTSVTSVPEDLKSSGYPAYQAHGAQTERQNTHTYQIIK